MLKLAKERLGQLRQRLGDGLEEPVWRHERRMEPDIGLGCCVHRGAAAAAGVTRAESQASPSNAKAGRALASPASSRLKAVHTLALCSSFERGERAAPAGSLSISRHKMALA